MKLSVQEQQLRALTETEWFDQVTELASDLGWRWAHFRPAQTTRGWRTPVQGSLGKGWPDLALFRERCIFVELKREKDHTSKETAEAQLFVHGCIRVAGIETFVFRPSDWDEVVRVLR